MDKRTKKNICKWQAGDYDSRNEAMIALRKDLYLLGVPSTKVGAVAERIWQVLELVTPHCIPYQQLPYGNGTAASRMLALWQGDDDAVNAMRLIGPALMSFLDPKRVEKRKKAQAYRARRNAKEIGYEPMGALDYSVPPLKIG